MPQDHRSRVGAQKRKQTRDKLIKSALRTIADHGIDVRMIDLVVREASVARGTFYNYFRTSDEIFHEVAKEVSVEILRIVGPLTNQQKDPAARVACGIRSVMKLAIKYPVLAQFIVRGGPPAITAGCLAAEVVPADIADGMAAGRFTITDKKLALDLILGPVIMALHTVLTAKFSKTYPNFLAQSVLQSLGVSKALAQKYAFQDFGEFEIPSDSIIAKASV